ncbi:MAG: hypothetical protein JWQ32_2859 [Marmoricola sp.]|nr:hypothetical protein [Marmoricola sp.]
MNGLWDEILDGLERWRADGTRFALATVVATRRSTPRPAGTAMAVSEHGEVLGSISGGCVESEVHELSARVLSCGRAELARYGVPDPQAMSVGLTCGGELDVFVEPVDAVSYPELDLVLDRIRSRQPVAIATWIADDERRGSHVVLDAAGAAVDGDGVDRVGLRLGSLLGTTSAHTASTCTPEEARAEPDVFLQSFAAPARMIVFGAGDFATAMARIGSFLGYRVTVCDARAVFATPERFPYADEVVVDWPHRYLTAQAVDSATVLCVLTHDPKFDVPLLRVALETEAAYIGVMGSRRASADLIRRLREAGVPEGQFARLRSPIGLDVGGRTPEETAVSIAAEIIAVTTGRTGLPLRDVAHPIHPVLPQRLNELAGR